MALFYTNWDCTNCNTPNKNNENYCSSCGEPKSSTPNYYLPKEEEEVTNKKDLAASKIDDCSCGNCGAVNRVNRDFCSGCGHLMTQQLDNIIESKFVGVDESEVIREDDLEIDTSEDERYDDSNMTYVESEYSVDLVENTPETISTETVQYDITQNEENMSYNFEGLGKIAIWVPLFLLILAFIIWVTSDTKIEITVDHFEWTSVRTVQNLKTFNESNWNKPATAYEVSSKREFHHSEDSFTHYKTVHYTVNEVVGQEPYQEKYTVEVECGQTPYQDCHMVDVKCGQKSYQDCHSEKVHCGYTTKSYKCGEKTCGTKINSNGYAEKVYCAKYCDKQVDKYCREQVCETKYKQKWCKEEECETKYKQKWCTESRTRTKYKDIWGDVAKTKQVAQHVNVNKYATKYYYTIDRWTNVSPSSIGAHNKNFNEVPNETQGKVRMSPAMNNFSIVFENKETKEKYKKIYEQQEWNSFEANHVYTVLTNKVGKFEFQ